MRRAADKSQGGYECPRRYKVSGTPPDTCHRIPRALTCAEFTSMTALLYCAKSGAGGVAEALCAAKADMEVPIHHAWLSQPRGIDKALMRPHVPDSEAQPAGEG